MRDHFAADWAFALVNSIAREVDKQFPSDAHRWPLLRVFDADVYEWATGWVLLVMKDRSTGGVPAVAGSPIPRACLVEAPAEPRIANVASLHETTSATLDLRPQDALVFLPIMAGDPKSVEDEWAMMEERHRSLWQTQLGLILTRHWYWLKGFDVSGNFYLPPGYGGLVDGCRAFFADNPDYSQNVFLMTRFDSTGYLVTLDNEIRSVLRMHALNPVRADDRVYVADRSLWDNVCVYMLCCSMGIAVLEDRGRDEFNPNVAMEYGHASPQ